MAEETVDERFDNGNRYNLDGLPIKTRGIFLDNHGKHIIFASEMQVEVLLMFN